MFTKKYTEVPISCPLRMSLFLIFDEIYPNFRLRVLIYVFIIYFSKCAITIIFNLCNGSSEQVNRRYKGESDCHKFFMVTYLSSVFYLYYLHNFPRPQIRAVGRVGAHCMCPRYRRQLNHGFLYFSYNFGLGTPSPYNNPFAFPRPRIRAEGRVGAHCMRPD
jgi:hypothetical protein